MQTTDNLDILMVCYGHTDLTECALETLVEHTNANDYTLHLLNNKPEDKGELVDMLESYGLSYMYHEFPNVGWIKAIETVYPLIASNYFLTVHNDVEFEKDWLPKMMRQFRDPKVAAVGPLISYVCGFQRTDFNLPGLVAEDANFIVGLFCIFRKSAVDDLIKLDGYFMDPQFGMGDKEEHDYCIRLCEAGYKLRIVRNVLIQHVGERGFVDLLGSKEKFTKYQEQQQAKLVAKWGQEKVDDLWKIDRTKAINVAIGIPLAGDYSGHRKFWESLLMMKKPGVFQPIVVPRVTIQHARNLIVSKALELNCTHVLFIDDDMIFPQDAAIRLLEHDRDIVCGLAFQRKKPHMPCIFRNVIDNDEQQIYPMEIVKQGLFEIDACGSAFVLIKTDVFRKLEEPWYVWGDKTLGVYVDKGGLGEDISFSLKAKRAGFEVFCDTDLIITHIGDNEEVTDIHYFAHKAKEENKLQLSDEYNPTYQRDELLMPNLLVK